MRQSAFQERNAGGDEVDYVAKDVTIRLFTAKPTHARIETVTRQVKIGKDVTVRYFDDPPRTRRESASAEGSALNSK